MSEILWKRKIISDNKQYITNCSTWRFSSLALSLQAFVTWLAWKSVRNSCAWEVKGEDILKRLDPFDLWYKRDHWYRSRVDKRITNRRLKKSMSIAQNSIFKKLSSFFLSSLTVFFSCLVLRLKAYAGNIFAGEWHYHSIIIWTWKYERISFYWLSSGKMQRSELGGLPIFRRTTAVVRLFALFLLFH